MEHKPEYDKKNYTHDCHEKYELIIEPVREIARTLGYALALHGTLKRDIDLVAIPWTSNAVDAVELANAIKDKIAEVNGAAVYHHLEDTGYFHKGCPGSKPHGRRCWCFHLGGGPYVDLSVMPLRTPVYEDYNW